MDIIFAFAIWLMSIVMAAQSTHNCSGRKLETCVNFFIALMSIVISLKSTYLLVAAITGNPQNHGLALLLCPVAPFFGLCLAQWAKNETPDETEHHLS